MILFPCDKYTEVGLLDHREILFFFLFLKIFKFVLESGRACSQVGGITEERERQRISSTLLLSAGDLTISAS